MTESPLRQATPLRSRGAQAGSGAVRVICGVHTLEAHVAGRTVGEVRGALAQALNVSPAAVAVVNGGEVGADYVLREGEQLEFVRLAGEKGHGFRFALPGSRFRQIPGPGRPGHVGEPGTGNREAGTEGV